MKKGPPKNTGQPMVGARDLGADEYNSTDQILNGMLDSRHVGPDAVPFSETEDLELSIQLEQTDGGTISVSPDGPYYSGNTVTLTATPDDGYLFVSWDGISASGAVVEVTITSDLTVSATFSVSTGVDQIPGRLRAYPNPFNKR